MPAWLLALGVRASKDVRLGWCGDFEGWDLGLLMGGVCGWERCVEHPRVFVAAVEAEHLLGVELEAGTLGFADHPDKRRMAERGLSGVVERPATTEVGVAAWKPIP